MPTALLVQTVKPLFATRETWVRSLGRGDPREKETVTQSSTLAWKIPWTEEPGGQQSMRSQRVGTQLRNSTLFFSLLSLLMPKWDLKLGPPTVKPERFSTFRFLSLASAFSPSGVGFTLSSETATIWSSRVGSSPDSWQQREPNDCSSSPSNTLNDFTRNPSFHGLGNQTCRLVIAPAESCGFSPSLALELRIEAPLAPMVLGAGPRETGRCAHVPPRAPGDALVTQHPRQAGQAGHSHSPLQRPLRV